MPDLAAPPSQVGESNQVENQRGGQEGVAPLPGELERHGRAQEPLEMDVVPGGFPVAKALDVLDRDQGLRRVAENLAKQMVFAGDLAGLVHRIVKHLSIEVAEDVVPDPTHHPEVAMAKHRGKHAFHQRFAGFPIAAHVPGVVGPRELVEGRRVGP